MGPRPVYTATHPIGTATSPDIGYDFVNAQYLLKEPDMNRFLPIALLLLTACAQLPPMPGDAAAKRFEPVSDRAVIYLARNATERDFVAPIMLNDEMMGATYRGTYMRFVVPGGKYRIAGFAGDAGLIDLQVQPGKIYFINQTTWGYDSLTGSRFELVDAQYGRSVVLSGTMTSELVR